MDTEMKVTTTSFRPSNFFDSTDDSDDDGDNGGARGKPDNSTVIRLNMETDIENARGPINVDAGGKKHATSSSSSVVGVVDKEGVMGVSGPEEEEVIKDFEDIMDIFHAKEISWKAFWTLYTLIWIQATLIGVCFKYTSPSGEKYQAQAILTACAFSAIAAVSEIFRELKRIFVGSRLIKEVLPGRKDGHSRRRIFLGLLHICNVIALGIMITLLVPLQGSPIDIILNSTAFLAILQLDNQALKYLDMKYKCDTELLVASARFEKEFAAGQKKYFILMVATMFAGMGFVVYMSGEVQDE